MQYLQFLFVLFFLLSGSDAFFGKRKEKEAEKDEIKLSGKDSATLGMLGIKNMAQSMSAKDILDLQEAMKDPETAREVQKLMNDPEFKAEMQKITSDPLFAKSMQSAQTLLGQETAANVYKQLSEEKKVSDFELGMNEMAKAAKNPKVLAEALEMLKDPEVAAEVEALMKDPAFMAQARKMTEDPNFKQAMKRASDDIEQLSNDPVLKQKLKAAQRN